MFFSQKFRYWLMMLEKGGARKGESTERVKAQSSSSKWNKAGVVRNNCVVQILIFIGVI